MVRSWSDDDLKNAIKHSKNITEVMKHIGLKALGSRSTIKRYINKLNIDISHFETKLDVYNRSLINFKRDRIPMSLILVEGSSYNRGHLKDRLYKEGYKKRVCELCGQTENWMNKKIALILDHKNGVNNDNRIENLRIVCPNCAAALDTHCGKKSRRYCPICGDIVKGNNRKYCSHSCLWVAKRKLNKNNLDGIHLRKVERPPYRELLLDIKNLGYVGTGKKYGVSDNAIRKWVKFYKNREDLIC